MAPVPDWKRALDTGAHFTEVRRSQARKLASDLAAQGQLARNQVSAYVDELVEPVDERRDEGVLVAIGVYMVECGEFTENSFRLSNRKAHAQPVSHFREIQQSGYSKSSKIKSVDAWTQPADAGHCSSCFGSGSADRSCSIG